ncbi:MAG: hypothetical protein K2L80_04225, partial [Muribaculaceae bacterium]|nr:hypothetical protein [Muribaculaceae bacterium]
RKIGVFAGQKVSSLSVLPTLDWAAEIARREDVAVVSGFHSLLERKVLEFLLRGRCGIIYVQARRLYKRPEEPYIEAFNAGRVLFVSNEPDTAIRASRATCLRRNQYVADIADELVFTSVSHESSIYDLTQSPKNIKIF